MLILIMFSSPTNRTESPIRCGMEDMEGPGINHEDSPLFEINVLIVLHELF